MKNVKTQMLNTDGGQLAARDFGGHGRDVLLIHGTGHSLEVWIRIHVKMPDPGRYRDKM